MSDLTDYIRRYSPPIEDTVFEEMKKLTEKHGVDYKKDLGYMEFPRPAVSSTKFNQIVAEAEAKLKELGYEWYEVFEDTINISFPGEKKAYEEWERAGKPTPSHSLHSAHTDSTCPRCQSSNTFHDAKTGVTECLKCGHKWKKPTIKEFMKGEVLDGFVEAARVKPLTEFSEAPEAVVREEEIPSFSPAFLTEVEKAWKEKRSTSFWDWMMEPTADGVTVTLRGTTKPHEFFPKDIIERMKYDSLRQVYVVV